MKHLIFFTFFLVLFAKNMSHSQDMRPGYIVLVSNDTLQGYVQYQPNDQLVDGFNFSEKENGSIIRYSPNQVKFFRYKRDKLFVARENYFEPDEYVDNELVFFEEIIKGQASLYKLNDDYYLEKDTSFVKLKNEKMLITNENGTFEKESKDYLKALGYYMADCPDLREQIFASDLSEKSLTRLARKYNECQGSHYIFYKDQKAGFKLEFNPYAGYEMTFFNNHSEQIQQPLYLEGNPNFNGINLGIRFIASFPRATESLSVLAGIGFQHWTANYSYYARENEGLLWSSKWLVEPKIDIAMLETPIGLRLKIGQRNPRFYLSAGMAMNLILSQTFNQKTYIINENNETGETTKEERLVEDPNGFRLTFKTLQYHFWAGPEYIILDKLEWKLHLSAKAKLGNFLIKDLSRFTYSSKFLAVNCTIGVIF